MEDAKKGSAGIEPVGIALNRRGTPARVRKRNRQFFDDDSIEVDFPGKRRKTSEALPTQTSAKKKSSNVASSKPTAKARKPPSPKKTQLRSTKKPSGSVVKDEIIPGNIELSRITELEKELEKCVDAITAVEGEMRIDDEPANVSELSVGPESRHVKKEGSIDFVPLPSDSVLVSDEVDALRDVEEVKSAVNDVNAKPRKSKRKIEPSRRLKEAQLASPAKSGSSTKSSRVDEKPPSITKKRIIVKKSTPSVKKSTSVKVIPETSSSEDDGSSDSDVTPDTSYNPLRALLPAASRAVKMPSATKSKMKTGDPKKQPSSSAEDFGVLRKVELIEEKFDLTAPLPSTSSVADGLLPLPSSKKKKPALTISFGPGKRLTERRKQELAAAAEAEVMRQKATQIAKRLRNFLKLPKAHRWISYEFFYSHIDRTLFLHENDFLTCLRDVFPKLQSLKLTRMEWNFIRRTFGKPRRCSPAFFAEERRTLEQKREKIRQLQAREIFPDCNSEYVPEMIPIPMSIGMRVTAKLSAPLSGLYDGVLQAIDTRNHTFRIKFDRPDVGLRTVEDYNVALAGSQESMMIPVNQYLGKIRRPVNAAGTVLGYSPMKPAPAGLRRVEDGSGSTSPIVGADDPCLAASDVPLKARLLEGNISAFPLQSLVNIVRVRKLLDIKRSKLEELKELNCQAELTRAQGRSYSMFFQRKYATLILDLEKLNADLNSVLKDVNDYCREVAPDEFPKSFSLLKDVSMSQARALVSSFNVNRGVSDPAQQPAGPSTAPPRPPDQSNMILSDENALQLITRVLALFLQIKSFADSGTEWNAYDLRALTDTLAEAKSHMRPANRAVFEASVEVQIRQVLAAMSHSRQATAGLEKIIRKPDELGEPS